MIPRIAAAGRSFQGAYQYYGHDKQATTKERVDWTHTENMITTCPEKAVKVMAYTALESERLKEASGIKAGGRKLEKPVFSFSLAWHPEQDPSKDHMLEAAMESVKVLGLQEHDTLVIAHRDTPHKHCHVIVNRVHPISGKAASVSHSKRRLSDFALQYEKEHGKIYCKQREENQVQRQDGKQTRYRDPVIQEAWSQSQNGPQFWKALQKKGYELAQGRKRIVAINPFGQALNPSRHIVTVKASDVTIRLKEIPRDQLQKADEVIAVIQKSRMHRYLQRLHNGALRSELLNDLQDRHHDEWARLVHKHQRQILREKERCEELYGIKEQKQTVEKLEERSCKTGFAAKISNAIRKTNNKLKAAQLNLESAQQRYSERVRGAESEIKTALEKLNEHHAKEREQLNALLDRDKPYLSKRTNLNRVHNHQPQANRFKLNQDPPSLSR